MIQIVKYKGFDSDNISKQELFDENQVLKSHNSLINDKEVEAVIYIGDDLNIESVKGYKRKGKELVAVPNGFNFLSQLIYNELEYSNDELFYCEDEDSLYETLTEIFESFIFETFGIDTQSELNDKLFLKVGKKFEKFIENEENE